MENQTQEQTTQAQTELSLEELIKGHVRKINEMNAELKKIREMYEDSFTNDPTFREAELGVKHMARNRSAVKLQISRQPSVANLAQIMKDIRFDINESKKTLSDLLVDYKEQTGATQLELFDGVVGDIVLVAKLVRARAKN